MNIVITGFMATGKTVVGKDLARRFRMKYTDTDEEIEKEVGYPIQEIFRKNGEPFFRDAESRVIDRVSCLDRHVIATGGGAVLREGNMKKLERNGFIICLTALPEVIIKRSSGVKTRPLLNVENPLVRIKALLKERHPYYQRCHLMIDTSDKSIRAVVREIIEFLKTKNIS